MPKPIPFRNGKLTPCRNHLRPLFEGAAYYLLVFLLSPCGLPRLVSSKASSLPISKKRWSLSDSGDQSTQRGLNWRNFLNLTNLHSHCAFVCVHAVDGNQKSNKLTSWGKGRIYPVLDRFLWHPKWCMISSIISMYQSGTWRWDHFYTTHLSVNRIQSRLFLEGQRVPPASQLFSNVRGSLGTILALCTARCRCHKNIEPSICFPPLVHQVSNVQEITGKNYGNKYETNRNSNLKVFN